MRRRALADLVSQHLENFEDGAARSAADNEDGQRDLEALLPTIHRLRDTLVPVEPSPQFRDALAAKLEAAWHEQRRQERVRDEQRRLFFFRAAAVGSFISVAALVAMVVRSRGMLGQARAQ